MAIKDSGSSLAISEIVAEFGDAAGGSDSLSEYYAGGQNVPSGATGESGSIPTSGTISMSQFYGSTNRIAIALQISSTTQNYNIYANRGGTYSSGISDVTLTVQAIVGSAGTGQHAIDTGNQWASGDTVKIINNSQIIGCGGAGGAGGQGQAVGAAGGGGGSALNLGIDTTVQNDGGRIRGGGGGGGGGGTARGVFVLDKNNQVVLENGGGGGGGGAGQSSGGGGAGGNSGQAGQANGGAGGTGGTSSQGGNSVKGGNGGSAGWGGAEPLYSYGGGGAGGGRIILVAGGTISSNISCDVNGGSGGSGAGSKYLTTNGSRGRHGTISKYAGVDQ